MNKIGPGGRSALGEACRSDNVKMVQMLLSQGADIEQPNPYFKDATPVTVAVISKHPEVVKFLIEVRIFSCSLALHVSVNPRRKRRSYKAHKKHSSQLEFHWRFICMSVMVISRVSVNTMLESTS